MKVIENKPQKLIVLSALLFILVSCKKEDKENNDLLKIISKDINEKVNTQFLTDVATLNLKVMVLTNQAKQKELNTSTFRIIEAIEDHHEDANKKIKKIAKKNLIIIPDTIYTYKNEIDSLNTNRDYEYLVELEELLKEEIQEYTKIKDNTNDTEIKTLANESIINLNSKLSEINSVLN